MQDKIRNIELSNSSILDNEITETKNIDSKFESIINNNFAKKIGEQDTLKLHNIKTLKKNIIYFFNLKLKKWKKILNTYLYLMI